MEPTDLHDEQTVNLEGKHTHTRGIYEGQENQVQ